MERGSKNVADCVWCFLKFITATTVKHKSLLIEHLDDYKVW